MNCTSLDESVDSISTFVAGTDSGFYIAISLLILLSCILLAFGERLVKSLSVVSGGAGACIVVYVFSDLFGIPCVVRIVAALIVGVLVALLALCLFTTGLVLLGSAAFGTVAHFVYVSLPLDKVDPPFLVVGLSGYYYLTIFLAGILGGIVAYIQEKNLIRVSSSLIGGGGAAVSAHLVSQRMGYTLPSILVLVILLSMASAGVFAQRHLASRKERARSRGSESKK